MKKMLLIDLCSDFAPYIHLIFDSFILRFKLSTGSSGSCVSCPKI